MHRILAPSYILGSVLIYLPAHNDMQYSRHRHGFLGRRRARLLAWLAAPTGGGLGTDSDRIGFGNKCNTV